MKSRNLKIRDCAILIGFNSEGSCVYSDACDISAYYDGEHVWDNDSKVKRLKLRKVRGYLFNSKGELFQEFESNFNMKTGAYESGFIRHADGTVHKD
jgi:hypothetical protein